MACEHCQHCKPAKVIRSELLQIRVTPEFKTLLELYAANDNIPVAGFIRQTLATAIRWSKKYSTPP